MTRWWLLLIPLAVGAFTLAVEAGYWFEPMRKQVVMEQVENGWTISECVVAYPCKITRVATSALQAQAIVWAYTSGKPPKTDWREP